MNSRGFCFCYLKFCLHTLHTCLACVVLATLVRLARKALTIINHTAFFVKNLGKYHLHVFAVSFAPLANLYDLNFMNHLFLTYINVFKTYKDFTESLMFKFRNWIVILTPTHSKLYFRCFLR